jgi:mercuric ion transport protein
MNVRTRIFGSSGGAVGFGAIAAALGACCVAPWAVAILGVGGAVALARLAFLEPLFVAGAVASLAFAFWSAYREPAACGDECTTRSRRSLRRVVWIAAFCVLALLLAAIAPAWVTLR